MSPAQVLLVLAPGLPLLAAAGFLVPALRAALMRLTPWTALPALILSLQPAGTELDLPWLLTGAQLVLDSTARLFLFPAAAVWWLGGLQLAGSAQEQARSAGFHLLYLLAMAGNLGLVLVGDLPGFYFAYALMGFAAYGLVVHGGDPQRRRAGRVYMVLLVAGEVMVFSAMVQLASARAILGLPEAQSVSGLAVGLLLAGFGVKAGVPLLHVALPLSYRHAPGPAAVVLAGAMIHAALLGWIRFLPLGQTALPGWALVFLVTGLAGAFYATLAGLTQRAPRALLAYSSMAQLGLMTTTLGLALAVPGAAPAAVSVAALYALHHAFAKSALFLGLPVLAQAPRGRRTWVLAGLALPALALAGLPLSTGALVKSQLKALSALGPGDWAGTLALLLPLSSVATTVLMLRFLWLARGAAAARAPAPTLPWLLALAGSVLGAWAWADPHASSRALSAAALGASAWPLAAGALTAALAARLVRLPGALQLPAGDILVVYEALWSWAAKAWARLGRVAGAAWAKLAGLTARVALQVGGMLHALARGEVLIGRWERGAAAYLLLVLALTAAAMAILY